jgi:hypothetical protein
VSDVPKKSMYPEATKGALSDSNESYVHPPLAHGPKMGDTQTKVTIFGVIFFIVFLAIFALSVGFGRYFTP